MNRDGCIRLCIKHLHQQMALLGDDCNYSQLRPSVNELDARHFPTDFGRRKFGGVNERLLIEGLL
jgi:hypothetical protein